MVCFRKLFLAALVCALTVIQAMAQTPGSAQALYRQLRSVGLDPTKVYDVRDAVLQRQDVHLALDTGTIAFTRAVDGRITGAFFSGEGEILLLPPDRAEKVALGLFTGAAILEEKFTTAYLRFNDDVFAELKASLRETDEPQAFIAQWGTAAEALAESDALRLLASFLSTERDHDRFGDHLLRARLAGTRFGVVDVFFDTRTTEQIAVRSLTYKDGAGYYDTWTSFPMRAVRQAIAAGEDLAPVWNDVRTTGYSITARIQPPTNLDAETTVRVEVLQPGSRIVFFELSRYLKLSEVSVDGKPLEFLQNEALEGSALARRGNDLVAIVFPEPLVAGQKMQLRFVYGGTVLSDAGGGLLYVGARGAWYPHRGPAMADFQLEFRYPANWTLVATGRRVALDSSGEEHVSRWLSERPIPLAGFNVGQYVRSTAKAGEISVESYTTQAMENAFPKPKPVVVVDPAALTPSRIPPQLVPKRGPDVLLPPEPNPAIYSEVVAQNSAQVIDFLSKRLGAFPYSSLALAQMPGPTSQGWPGLVFLSSYAYLTPEQRTQAHLSDFDQLVYGELMQAHETAHQWWGDLVMWKTYRDQWLVEALSNYCALLLLEKDHPKEFREILDHYRDQLLAKDKEGRIVAEAGPVSLGLRLSSSRFPNGFDAISYGRGTWLFHMLRNLLRDPRGDRRTTEMNEPFFQALRKLLTQYAGKEVSTTDVQGAFETVLPESSRLEGRKSLDWFFDGWVNGTAVPKLALQDIKYSRKGTSIVATGKVMQKEAPEDLITAVPVYANVSGKAAVFVGRVFADGPETVFRFTVPVGTRKLVLDPYGTVLSRP